MDAVLPVLAMQEHGPYIAVGLGTQLLLHDRRSAWAPPVMTSTLSVRGSTPHCTDHKFMAAPQYCADQLACLVLARVSCLSQQEAHACHVLSTQHHLYCGASCSSGAALELPGAEHTGAIRTMAFDPTGRLFMAGGDDKTVRVWDLHTRQLLHSWSAPLLHLAPR